MTFSGFGDGLDGEYTVVAPSNPRKALQDVLDAWAILDAVQRYGTEGQAEQSRKRFDAAISRAYAELLEIF